MNVIKTIIPPTADLVAAHDRLADAVLDTSIPGFLARTETPDQKAKVAKIVAAELKKDPKMPKVKNPKDVKPGKTGLGAAPGELKSAGAKPKAAKPAGKPAKAPKAAKATTGTPKAKTAPVASAARTDGVRPGTKLALIVELLKRPQGCTTADVLKATSWPAVSMPQQAKAAGLTLKKEKVDGRTVYRAA